MGMRRSAPSSRPVSATMRMAIAAPGPLPPAAMASSCCESCMAVSGERVLQDPGHLRERQAWAAGNDAGGIGVGEIAQEVRFDGGPGQELLVHPVVVEAGHRTRVEPEGATGTLWTKWTEWTGVTSVAVQGVHLAHKVSVPCVPYKP